MAEKKVIIIPPGHVETMWRSAEAYMRMEVDRKDWEAAIERAKRRTPEELKAVTAKAVEKLRKSTFS